MNLGPFDKLCTIEYPASAPDANTGRPVITWTLLRTGWFQLQDELPSTSEAVRQGLVTTINRTRARGNYCTDLTAAMRLKNGGMTYQIVSGPAVIGDNEAIEMYCERHSTVN